VIVAGVSLDANGYVWGDPFAAQSRDYQKYRSAWTKAQAELRGQVVAVSGWLRDLLGAPQREAVPA
jgi:hypothetical protein